MLPKKYRLTIAEFNQIPQKQKELNNDYFLVKIKKERNTYPKIAITVPKFLDKRSSYRHKTKRMIKEMLKNKIIKLKRSTRLLIKPKKIFKKENTRFISVQLEALLQKTNSL